MYDGGRALIAPSESSALFGLESSEVFFGLAPRASRYSDAASDTQHK